jgi:hypothetical protein
MKMENDKRVRMRNGQKRKTLWKNFLFGKLGAWWRQKKGPRGPAEPKRDPKHHLCQTLTQRGGIRWQKNKKKLKKTARMRLAQEK